MFNGEIQVGKVHWAQRIDDEKIVADRGTKNSFSWNTGIKPASQLNQCMLCGCLM
jgi:hypothetical protein